MDPDPSLSTPPQSKPNLLKSILLNRISLIIIAAIVISGLGLATTYILVQQQNTNKTKETVSIPPEASQAPPSELVEGKISQIKDNTLTLKQNDGQSKTVQIASGAAILKQKRFGPNSIGTIPATLSAQIGSLVSVSATKDSDGNLETNLVVILDPEIEQ